MAYKILNKLSPESLWNKYQYRSAYSNYWTCNKSLSRQKREKEKKRERLVILGMLINIHEISSLLPFSKWQGCCQLSHRSLSRPLSKSIAEPRSVVPLSFLSIWLDIGFLLKDADWTESCPANDPGYQVLQVSLAFFPSPFFPRERLVASPSNYEKRNCNDLQMPRLRTEPNRILILYLKGLLGWYPS